jgi:cobalt-precorrin 5A hydrolase
MSPAQPNLANQVNLAIGLGCDRGVALATLQAALDAALAQAGFTRSQVAVLASIEAKSDEPALLQLATLGAWPLLFFSAAELAQVPVPNPSNTVLRHMGTPSVSEAAALLAAGSHAEVLLVEKFKHLGLDHKNATISIARMTHD